MKDTSRKIAEIIEPQAVVEGAGVRLKRSIGTHTLDYLDPFLLLDHFQSKNPADYQAGFPLHPHRGIETVTYLLAGAVRHRDSVGNAGEIGPGDLQWMTAGRGIMHEEMPQVRPEGVAGFQLWVNLPAKQKMIAPRYQNIHANEIAEIQRDGGAKVRVIAGSVDGVVGPISGIAAEPMYLDVSIAPHGSFNLPIPRGHSAFSYVFEGEGRFGPEDRTVTGAATRGLGRRRWNPSARGRRRCALSSGVGQTVGRADRALWSVRDEYQSGDRADAARASSRDVCAIVWAASNIH